MKRFILLTSIPLFVMGVPLAQADLIDFESGYSDLDPVGTAVTATNSTTFTVAGGGTGFIAKVGAPTTAYAPGDAAAAARVGDFFLSDELAGPTLKLDYFIDFASPVLNLSLDVLDYRGDGGGSIGDTATLNVYSDAARTNLVGTDVFTIVAGLPDPNLFTLSVGSPSGSILAASLVFDKPDVGTGIDNIEFTTVPVPGAALLAFIAMPLIARRRRGESN